MAENGFKDMITACGIFARYAAPHYPFVCTHDVLWVVDVDPAEVDEVDRARLDELGFEISDDGRTPKQFYSYRFGSA